MDGDARNRARGAQPVRGRAHRRRARASRRSRAGYAARVRSSATSSGCATTPDGSLRIDEIQERRGTLTRASFRGPAAGGRRQRRPARDRRCDGGSAAARQPDRPLPRRRLARRDRRGARADQDRPPARRAARCGASRRSCAGSGTRSFEVSIPRGEGIEQVRELIGQRRAVLAGHSGVGKTTLSNALTGRRRPDRRGQRDDRPRAPDDDGRAPDRPARGRRADRHGRRAQLRHRGRRRPRSCRRRSPRSRPCRRSAAGARACTRRARTAARCRRRRTSSPSGSRRTGGSSRSSWRDRRVERGPRGDEHRWRLEPFSSASRASGKHRVVRAPDRPERAAGLADGRARGQRHAQRLA